VISYSMASTLQNFPLTTEQIMQDLENLKEDDNSLFSSILANINPNQVTSSTGQMLLKNGIGSNHEILEEAINLTSHQIGTTLKKAEDEQYNMVSTVFEDSYKGTSSFLHIGDWLGTTKVTLNKLLVHTTRMTDYLVSTLALVKGTTRLESVHEDESDDLT